MIAIDTSLWFSNLLSWWTQALVLCVAGGLLLILGRSHLSARLRLVWAQMLLGACILAPLTMPRQTLRRFEFTPNAAPPLIKGTPVPDAPAPWPWREIALGVLAAGVVLRLGWLGLGCWRLSRYARASEPWPDATELDAVMRQASVVADVGISAEVATPVTFGFLAPVVLVPPSFPVLSAEARQAVLYHELLHIRRRDWAMVLAEEIVRALAWFQPAVWFLLGQIHLCREQVVDDEVVRMTGRRREYLDALIAVARGRAMPPDLAPAPLFLKRRHLASRVEWLVQEVPMTMRKAIAAVALALAVVGTSGWYAARAFPLQAQAVEPTPGVKADPGSMKLLHATAPQYPVDALNAGITGDVVLELSVNAKGIVSDAKVISGPEELRSAALEAVLKWHYSPVGSPATTRATVTFAPTDQEKQTLENMFVATKKLQVARMPSGPSRIVKSVDFGPMPESLKEAVRSHLRVQVGSELTDASLADLQAGLREVDPEHLGVAARTVSDGVALYIWKTVPPSEVVVQTAPRIIYGGQSHGVIGGVPGGVTGGVSQSTDAKPPIPQQIRVGGVVQQSKLLKKVAPVYPPEAKAARLQGTVRLTATIDKEGNIRALELVAGHPLLVQSAVDAVKQWQYATTLLNGNPVEVITTIDINYTLTE
jgi:TonB family protein